MEFRQKSMRIRNPWRTMGCGGCKGFAQKCEKALHQNNA